MQYRIGEIASLLNLSAQSLRKYEDEGIITPQKSAGSAYRYYSGWDLILLSACRQYRALDFSLGEISQLLNCGEPDAVPALLRQQEDVLAQLIEAYTLKKQAISAWRKQVEHHRELEGQFRVEENEETYCLAYQQGDQLLKDAGLHAQLAEWYGYIPYVYCAMQLPMAAYPERVTDYTVSLCMAAEALQFLHIGDMAHLTHIPKRRCLHTAMVLDSDGFQNGEPYRQVIEYAQAHGVTLRHDETFFCRLNLICKGEKGLRFLVDCLAPLARQ